MFWGMFIIFHWLGLSIDVYNNKVIKFHNMKGLLEIFPVST